MLAEGKDLLDTSLDAPLVLSKCEDFDNEKGALQESPEDISSSCPQSAIPNWLAAASSIPGEK